jgi:hypothetical protein
VLRSVLTLSPVGGPLQQKTGRNPQPALRLRYPGSSHRDRNLAGRGVANLPGGRGSCRASFLCFREGEAPAEPLSSASGRARLLPSLFPLGGSLFPLRLGGSLALPKLLPHPAGSYGPGQYLLAPAPSGGTRTGTIRRMVASWNTPSSARPNEIWVPYSYPRCSRPTEPSTLLVLSTRQGQTQQRIPPRLTPRCAKVAKEPSRPGPSVSPGVPVGLGATHSFAAIFSPSVHSCTNSWKKRRRQSTPWAPGNLANWG